MVAGVDPEAPQGDGVREDRQEVREDRREADPVREAQSEHRREWLLRNLRKLGRQAPIQAVAREPKTHSNGDGSKGLKLTFAPE